MFTLLFWKAALERAVKTAAQFGLAAWGADRIFVQVSEIAPTYQLVGLAGLSGATLSILTSIGSDWVSKDAGPSLTNAEVLPTEPTGDHEGE